ncbi:MAG: dTDP-4-dehydrorhamnose reductase [Frankiales bacterium]|jgi:dTDP-4-dehydrorhamnose reductase|nr:dTDP-4-dehydrorhamnose reductase [Frankiales bacterium]
MRFLVTGAGGQLGRDVLRVIADRDVVGLTRSELDVADPSSVATAFETHRPDIVINTAAWTDVDGAEEDEAAAVAINRDGPANLAAHAASTGAILIHVSTDYVFDGTATMPYDEDTPIAPRSAYGRSKAAGEQVLLASAATAYVVRTAWLYGAGGRNFVRTMATLARGKQDVRVVDDQRGSPTWTYDLATGLVALADSRPAPGIYHATSSGDTTWCGFARAIFAAVGADSDRVQPVTTAEYPRPAPRPAYSVLGDRRWRAAGLPPLPNWMEALERALAAEGATLTGS